MIDENVSKINKKFKRLGNTCRVLSGIMKVFTMVVMLASLLLFMMAFAMPQALLDLNSTVEYNANVNTSQLGVSLKSKNIDMIGKFVKKLKYVKLESANSKGLAMSFKIKREEVSTKTLGLLFISVFLLSVVFFLFLCSLNRFGKAVSRRENIKKIRKQTFAMLVFFSIWFLLKAIPASMVHNFMYATKYITLYIKFSDIITVLILIIIYNLFCVLIFDGSLDILQSATKYEVINEVKKNIELEPENPEDIDESDIEDKEIKQEDVDESNVEDKEIKPEKPDDSDE
ncbi:MAG: hypothetical protein K6G11_01590 [Lachnospiraceae bacterium]|nr:hypothetical protein [Lachnospiraceae bacterium]